MATNYETQIKQLASDVGSIQLTPGEKDKSSTIKVLSWNIHGSSAEGMAEARKSILKSVIGNVEPDVMLLQETIKSIDSFFEDTGIPKKDYNYEEAKEKKETRVIYKNNAFEKVDPSPVNLNTVLAEMVPEDETKFLRRGKVPERQMIKNGICVVHLRHISTKREIIFVSYHNIRHSGGKMTNKVCEIIASLHESNECYVIAGVDFNCDISENELVQVPPYTTTPRRKGKEKVDFYILSNSTKNWVVKAIDLAPFHKKLQNEGVEMNLLNKACDHDPLQLSLSEVKREEDGKVKEDEEEEERRRRRRREEEEEEERRRREEEGKKKKKKEEEEGKKKKKNFNLI